MQLSQALHPSNLNVSTDEVASCCSDRGPVVLGDPALRAGLSQVEPCGLDPSDVDPYRVAALFVEAGGCYFDLPGVIAWDEARDARLYAGPYPVVAHPPCDRWHQLSAVNNKRWGFTINEDGGCFAAALAAVRKWGGVLEHPAESRAFKFHRIPEPAMGFWQRTIDGDWVTEVWQSAYGHRARKRTWLLYSGAALPMPLDWRRVRGAFQIGNFDPLLPGLPKAEVSATPIQFRDVLLSIARGAVPTVDHSVGAIRRRAVFTDFIVSAACEGRQSLFADSCPMTRQGRQGGRLSPKDKVLGASAHGADHEAGAGECRDTRSINP